MANWHRVRENTTAVPPEPRVDPERKKFTLVDVGGVCLLAGLCALLLLASRGGLLASILLLGGLGGSRGSLGGGGGGLGSSFGRHFG